MKLLHRCCLTNAIGFTNQWPCRRQGKCSSSILRVVRNYILINFFVASFKKRRIYQSIFKRLCIIGSIAISSSFNQNIKIHSPDTDSNQIAIDVRIANNDGKRAIDANACDSIIRTMWYAVAVKRDQHNEHVSFPSTIIYLDTTRRNHKIFDFIIAPRQSRCIRMPTTFSIRLRPTMCIITRLYNSAHNSIVFSI